MWLAFLFTTTLSHAGVRYRSVPALRAAPARQGDTAETHFDVDLARAGEGFRLRLQRAKILLSPESRGLGDLWQVLDTIFLSTPAGINYVNEVLFAWIDPATNDVRSFIVTAEDIVILQNKNERREVRLETNRQKALMRLFESNGNFRRVRGAHVELIGPHDAKLGAFELSGEELRDLVHRYAPGPARRLYAKLCRPLLDPVVEIP